MEFRLKINSKEPADMANLDYGILLMSVCPITIQVYKYGDENILKHLSSI
jgi:hypothetical protein